MGPLAVGGLITGAIGAIGSLFGAKKSNKELGKLLKQDPSYTANPLAAQRLAMSQNLLNARMPGAARMENNLFTSQANSLAGINRNATDSSQALALAAGVQGQTDQSLNQLGMQEAQDYQRRYNNLTEAQQGQIGEDDKVYQDQIRRFEDSAKIKGAQIQNRQSAWNSLSQLGFGAMGLGLSNPGQTGGGMFGGLFGNHSNRTAGSFMTPTDISAMLYNTRAANPINKIG
jgi:hypothetical protein